MKSRFYSYHRKVTFLLIGRYTVKTIIIIALIAIGACKNSTNKSKEEILESTTSVERFTKIKFPSYFTKDEDSITFLAKHYWDNFLNEERLLRLTPRNLSDIFDLSSKEFADVFLNYILILQSMNNLEKEKVLFKEFIDKANIIADRGDKSLLLITIKCSEEVLYNPRSPYIDEELYIPILEEVLSTKNLSEEAKSPYLYQYKVVSKNRVGSKGADIQYGTRVRENSKGEYIAEPPFRKMYDLKSDYLLLLFSDPDCSNCEGILRKMKSSGKIIDLVGAGQLKILSIYTESNLKVWESKRGDYPIDWIYAYYPKGSFGENDPYIIRSIPSFYLLDKDKNVILKDVSLEKIISFFSSEDFK